MSVLLTGGAGFIGSHTAVDQILVVTISGRGDKDVAAIARYKGVEIYE